MLPRFSIRFLTFIAALALAPFAQLGRAQTLAASTDHPAGIYKRGEPVRFQLQSKGEGELSNITYQIKTGGLTVVKSGKVELKDQAATIEITPDAPGAILLELKAHPAVGKDITAAAGALVAPEEIKPSAPRPDDFDAFWKSKIDEVAKIPANAQLKEIPGMKTGVAYYKITLDNIGGSHIQGQLARPVGGGEGKKFPAMLIVQWAGVYGLDKNTVTGRAAQGWLTLNIEPHDIPIDETVAYYKAQEAGPLFKYAGIGAESRETSYFLHMYLACYQAAEYLANRPDWDGKTLVVTGNSMGGQQTLVTAALSPRITAALALVPAGCDLTGALVGRDPGFPKSWYLHPGTDPKKALEASRYFDVVNFAPRIKCPVLIGMGLIDTTCPPAGVYAACNQVKAPKELVVLPKSEHQEHGGSQAPFNQRQQAWLTDLQKGNPAPLAPAKTP